MTGPRNASKIGDKRIYNWHTGERFWSVTTIIGGGVPKPALLPWGVKMVAESAVRKHKTLAAMLAECETPETCKVGSLCDSCDAAVRWLKGAPYRDRDKKADLGTRVHAAAEAYRLGQPMPPWPIEIAPHMAQFEQFLRAFTPTFESVEQTVYSRSERYAGTLDAVVQLSDGRRLLIDYKTGEKGPYPEVGLQLSAYRYADFRGLPDGTEEPVPEVDGCAVLKLTANAWQLIDVRADDEVFTSFRYVRECFRFMEEISKTVIGDAIFPTVTLIPEAV